MQQPVNVEQHVTTEQVNSEDETEFHEGQHEDLFDDNGNDGERLIDDDFMQEAEL